MCVHIPVENIKQRTHTHPFSIHIEYLWQQIGVKTTTYYVTLIKYIQAYVYIYIYMYVYE